MMNTTPTPPSFVLGYWRPWNEGSNLFDSWLDYVKDSSLAEYSARIVGEYVASASKEQVQAIAVHAQIIGSGLDLISHQLADVKRELGFVSRTIELQTEQQRVSNLLLENIGDLLRVPESEKDRRHAIELGVKFFVNAQKDEDLFDDALEEFLKAETLMKQDYFVLHHIGLVYLYSHRHVNPSAALDYFSRAAKYATVESDPRAARLMDVLQGRRQQVPTLNSSWSVSLVDSGRQKIDVIRVLRQLTGIGLKEGKDIVDNVPSKVKEGVGKAEAKSIKQLLETAGARVEISGSGTPQQQSGDASHDLESIATLAADSYEKAALSAYILGDFEAAETYQSKAVKLDGRAGYYLLLAKYQTRAGHVDLCIENIEKAIDRDGRMAFDAIRDLDLANEPKVLNLIERKSRELDESIHRLIEELARIDAGLGKQPIRELEELLEAPFDRRVSELVRLSAVKDSIESKIGLMRRSILDLSKEFESPVSLLKPEEIRHLGIQLKNCFNQPYELMKTTYDLAQVRQLETIFDHFVLEVGQCNVARPIIRQSAV
jgi:large subunit ribosomal protein L7/L12